MARKVAFLNLLTHPPNPPKRNAPRRVPFWSPLCTYARRVLSGSGRVGEAAEPLGQNELKDTDQDLIFVCRTLPVRTRENGSEAVYPSKRLTHTHYYYYYYYYYLSQGKALLL